MHLTDPGLLAQLRSQHTAAFTLTEDQMPAGRAELKIIGLQLAMVGATATDPTFGCLLTHEGDAINSRVDGAVLEIHAPPAGPVVIAAQKGRPPHPAAPSWTYGSCSGVAAPPRHGR